MATKRYVYQVMCQSDMTEGRGGLRRSLCFNTEELAWEYADKQEGIMGRRPPNGSWKHSGMGDWQVQPIEVLAELPMNEREVLEKAADMLKGYFTEDEMEFIYKRFNR